MLLGEFECGCVLMSGVVCVVRVFVVDFFFVENGFGF